MGNTKSERDYFINSGLREIALLRKYFNIDGIGDKVKVTKLVSPKNVVGFYREYFASVRPSNLSKDKTLPRSDNNKLRGLYLGQPDVNIVLNLIVRHCLYVDQIVLIDPFMSPVSFGVLDMPEGWMEVLINRALCLCALEEWIKQNIVIIIPDPIYFRPEVTKIIEENASQFMEARDDNKDWKFMVVRALVNEEEEHREAFLDLLERMGQNFSVEERTSLLYEASEFEKKYPIRFKLSKEFYKKYFDDVNKHGQVLDFSTGTSLIAAPYIAEAMGAFLLFEHRHHFDEIRNKFKENQSSGSSRLQKIAIAFQQLDFPFLHNVPLTEALELRQKGYLSRFRVYLKDLWDLSSSKLQEKDLNDQFQEFSDRLKSEYEVVQQEWGNIKKELRAKAVASGLIIGMSAGSALVFGNIAIPLSTLSGLGAGLLKEYFFGGYSETSEKVAQTTNQPLFVFLTLENK
ncbi:MAG TPA: hypothetical protein PLG52_03725 [Anaerolineales bacterium]|nr:hypothetical protein [Anaerolineales bacterium]